MDKPEGVIHIVECHGVGMVLGLLRESIGQAGKPPHRHVHRQILAFYIARGDMLPFRITLDTLSLDANTFDGTIPRLGLRRGTVQLN